MFVRHENTNAVVKTYGPKFVALGLANLTDSKLTDATTNRVLAIYEDTSAYIHPSATELACFVEKRDGRRVATAPGIKAYADIPLLSTLCLKLDDDYGLGYRLSRLREAPTQGRPVRAHRGRALPARYPGTRRLRHYRASPHTHEPTATLGYLGLARARTVFGKPGSDGRECPARGSPASPPSHWAERAAEGAASASSGLLRAP